MGRAAHLTKPQPIHFQQGRAQCQHRTICERGCPFGGYFSSNSSTIPWAAKTGKMTLRPNSVVHSIIYDEKKGRATGVRVVDAHTKQMTEYYARIIFLNAAALNSNLVLLNSTSTVSRTDWAMTVACWVNTQLSTTTGRVSRQSTMVTSIQPPTEVVPTAPIFPVSEMYLSRKWTSCEAMLLVFRPGAVRGLTRVG